MHRHLASLVVIALFACAGVAADSARELAGRVVDEKGKPVAGAKVIAIGGPAVGNVIQEPASTVTGVDGAFRFGKEKPQGAAVVVASKEGKCIDWAIWTEAGSAKLVLQLGPPAVIEGDIVDEAGKPVVGAAVAMQLTAQEPAAKQMFFPLRAAPFVAKTDAQGHFRFASLSETATAAFDITAPGKARPWRRDNSLPGRRVSDWSCLPKAASMAPWLTRGQANRLPGWRCAPPAQLPVAVTTSTPRPTKTGISAWRE